MKSKLIKDLNVNKKNWESAFVAAYETTIEIPMYSEHRLEVLIELIAFKYYLEAKEKGPVSEASTRNPQSLKKGPEISEAPTGKIPDPNIWSGRGDVDGGM